MIGTKASFRQLLRVKRQNIPVAYRHQAATRAAELFSATDFFKQSNHFACYAALSEEFDCMPLIKKIWQAHKKCYLPVLSTKAPKTLRFTCYQPNDVLQLNRYGILEPAAPKFISLEQLTIVIVPLVGFDLAGHRLGMGSGYYDRTFQFLSTKASRPCRLFGLAFATQYATVLPQDSWDVLLDGVITEEEVIFF